jgi:hypothetical protein
LLLALAGCVLAGCGGDGVTRQPAAGAGPGAEAPDAGAAAIGPASPVSPSASAASSSPAPPASGSCPTFPADNVWRADVSRLRVHPSSADWVNSIGATGTAHPDVGSGLIDGAPFGIPVTTVPAGQPGVRVTFEYGRESDPGPYPLPADARVEGGPNGGGDRHVLALDRAACRVYELFAARRNGDGSWRAGSGAVFDLRSHRLRPAGWTSADAAGLSIYAGLARYDEFAAGRIDHALRFTAPRTRNTYVWPARHAASDSGDAARPPMGARFRLKASVDISRFPPQARVIAEALKRYGAILADNGSPWFFTGTEDAGWSNTALRALKTLTGNDFEAVDTAPLMADPNSGAVRG